MLFLYFSTEKCDYLCTEKCVFLLYFCTVYDIVTELMRNFRFMHMHAIMIRNACLKHILTTSNDKFFSIIEVHIKHGKYVGKHLGNLKFELSNPNEFE